MLNIFLIVYAFGCEDIKNRFFSSFYPVFRKINIMTSCQKILFRCKVLNFLSTYSNHECLQLINASGNAANNFQIFKSSNWEINFRAPPRLIASDSNLQSSLLWGHFHVSKPLPVHGQFADRTLRRQDTSPIGQLADRTVR